MVINPKDFINTIKAGVKKVGNAGGTVLSYPARLKYSNKIIDNNSNYVTQLMKRIPSNIPQEVKDKAKKDMSSLATKGDYAGARKYLQGLK